MLIPSIDFTKTIGKINPDHHGSNSTIPFNGGAFTRDYNDLGFTFSRTHDWALWINGQRIIDTHFIFPLMHLDPTDPKNYFFTPTDDIIKKCIDSGSKVFYRLGTSIEHTGNKHYNTVVPDDFEKYAEVLAAIVRHYTKGWANGFTYDITHWEIWNEPDLGEAMWLGTAEEFARLFAIVLKRLKDEFPTLQIGGPALCGPKEDYFKLLFAECDKLGVRPDFISWHCYTADPDFLIEQPKAMRDFLDAYGYKDTKLVINEWHYFPHGYGISDAQWNAPNIRQLAYNTDIGMGNIDSAVFNLAVLSGWQKTPLDIGCYYGASPNSLAYGYYNSDFARNKCYYSMKLFGDFVAKAVDMVESPSKLGKTYTIAGLSSDRKKGYLILSNYRSDDETLEVDLKGLPENTHIDVRILDANHDLAPIPFIWHDGRLTLTKTSRTSAAFFITVSL